MHAYCWASGKIEFGRRVPVGAIRFASGPAATLRKAVEPAARLARDNATLLVPGVPEAADLDVAGDALAKWIEWRRADWVQKGLIVVSFCTAEGYAVLLGRR